MTVVTDDGETIHGYSWPPPATPAGGVGASASSPPVWLVVFHGNAGTREDRLPWLAWLRRTLGVGITIWDYRGYGGSTGQPSQRGLYLDGRAVARWCGRCASDDSGGVGSNTPCAPAEGAPPRNARCVLYGESIGSSVATWAATAHGSCFDGLVLHAPFTSVTDAGAANYWFLPVRWLSRHKFDTESFCRRLPRGLPKLVLHGTDDTIVPHALGARLHAALDEPKSFVSVQGAGHNDLPLFRTAYLGALGGFLKKVAGGSG